ncbi:MAG: C39 family peptidase [Candidatus Woesearchaeota archaeon]|nr:C39 family peptidase [Candidatus Woesearchaeota archaeon]
MRKGYIFLIGAVITFLLAMFGLYVAVSAQANRFEGIIGENQAKVLDTYKKGERILFLMDMAARYAYIDSLRDLDMTTDCGEFEGVPLINTKEKNCLTDINNKIAESTKSKMNEFLRKADIPAMDYEATFRRSILFKSEKSLRTDVGDELNLAMSDKKVIVEKKPDAAPTTPATPATPTTPGTGTKPTTPTAPTTPGGQKCSYCYKPSHGGAWSQQWGNYVKSIDPDAQCGNTGCCVADCPPDAKIIDVPYTNQCQKDMRLGTHPESVSYFGYENFWKTYDACAAMCGPTSTKMMVDYYGGTWNKDLDWKPLKRENDWYGNAYRSKMPKLIESKTGIPFTMSPRNDYASIKYWIDQGKPVLSGMYIPGGCPEYSPYTFYCWNGMGHIWVIVGYSKDYVIINDPYTNEAGWAAEWSHHVVLPISAYAKVANGDSVIKE